MHTNGETFLGIELGSTRIKAVLIDESYAPVASGSFEWENRFENGVWTYHMDDVWTGVQTSYKRLADDYRAKFGQPLTMIGGIGISAMMHGYLPFDKDGKLLAEFRTWRNTSTEKAAAILTSAFDFNIPQRWSIAHLYQAVLNDEEHVGNIAFLTSLAGYVHFCLTGEKVLGIGDASGVFPIDSATNRYHYGMLEKYEKLAVGKGPKLVDILPGILLAGEQAGCLTEKGALLLDPSGTLKPGIPFCPPEGDAGTGMVATNTVAQRTGNISAGTSVFAMLVLEKELSKLYIEIDMVTTPAGKPVAMVHCNNCTSDLDAWVGIMGEATALLGLKADKSALYETLYQSALQGDPDSGGLLSYNYLSGEPITGFDKGKPLFIRTADSRFTLANFMRNLIFSALGTLKIGMDILTDKEKVKVELLLGHGGLFKTKEVGQKLMAGALNVPVAVMESAGEGGAWGIALLAAFMGQSIAKPSIEETLEVFLNNRVFANNAGSRVYPDERDVKGFADYMERYEAGLSIMRAAIE